MDGDETFVGEPIARGFAPVSTPPFARKHVAAVYGNNILTADNSRFEITAHDTTGRTLSVDNGYLRWPGALCDREQRWNCRVAVNEP